MSGPSAAAAFCLNSSTSSFAMSAAPLAFHTWRSVSVTSAGARAGFECPDSSFRSKSSVSRSKFNVFTFASLPLRAPLFLNRSYKEARAMCYSRVEAYKRSPSTPHILGAGHGVASQTITLVSTDISSSL